jgi:hypothetical protein
MTFPSLPMPRHGVAGAVIGNRFHLVSGMIQSAGALSFLDPTLSTHTAMHDILELQFRCAAVRRLRRARHCRLLRIGELSLATCTSRNRRA